MRRMWLIILVSIFGCGPREHVPAPQPEQAQRKLPTAAQYNLRLLGKTQDQVVEELGAPSDTFSTWWRYNDCKWNEFAQKREHLYVRFGTDGCVVKCD